MFAYTLTSHPSQLTPTNLTIWFTHGNAANNTVRARLATARTFLKWCYQTGHIDHSPVDLLPNITKQFPTTYGRAQAKNPARWLTADEAAQLIDACKDRTWTGSRDQLIIRFGLLGIRAAEIAHMTWGNLLPDGRLQWIGKARKQRTANPGPTLTDLLTRWRRRYEQAIGRPVAPSDPIICRQVSTRWAHLKDLQWGTAITQNSVQTIVNHRAQLAGLGHVAPHDLRRSAAGILHNTRTPNGAHVYDLLDIQRVLDHADPTTTMKAYLIPMGEQAKADAGRTLDF